ncbi:related to ubiquitin-specific protease [Serendipita indica DSM 11827]|uniref:Ubiquitin carboxyl-terminal hydrolase n=1 Tax=Serendipita indica (strain DSM 11827) TaxID=1109443 RepID=G4T5B2_SERID|nr:related to ubiquitin-specific protease [Serendipita indica DSM 11827]
MSISVSIKHAGKAQNVELDTSQPLAAFKQTIYEATGVPVDRMKVMSKGLVLKDDTPWSKLAIKPGHQFMIIGVAGELPKPPEKPVVFLEDMGDSELASTLRLPVGLTNLGNTCYMNSTLQVLRTIPELNPALEQFTQTSQGGLGATLTAEMRRLYQSMNQTTDKMIPAVFLQRLRMVAPQFAEQRPGQGFAQQDAEECLTSILNALRESSLVVPPNGNGEGSPKNLVENYIMGEMTTELKCDEAPDEETSTSKSTFSKLECNISITTNYLQTGIKESLDQKIEKQSPSLGRSAIYSQKSRISRLPSNLIVHMVRFYWRRDINKKAKIMRKVKFPFEYDVLDLVTEELKQKLLPVNTRLKEIEKDRQERRKVRKRTRKVQPGASVEMPIEPAPPVSPTVMVGGPDEGTGSQMDVDQSGSTIPVIEPGTADEAEIRRREAEELTSLVHDDLKSDAGANVTGMYELVGIITHKGASADSGHYIGFARADVFTPRRPEEIDETTDQWIKFDDDKVSVMTEVAVGALDGGGEDSAAYILLYRSKLPL